MTYISITLKLQRLSDRLLNICRWHVHELICKKILFSYIRLYIPVLPKYTLFKVLYFILAKFKNYTLFICFQSNTLQILYYRIKLFTRIIST